jgi:hypothetical protein
MGGCHFNQWIPTEIHRGSLLAAAAAELTEPQSESL